MKPHNIPIFALPCVIFPNERIPFHIFEERYLRMVRQCMSDDLTECTREFGVLCATKEETYTVGCAVRIAKILARHDDGSIDILTHGTRRFQVDSFLRTGEVENEYPVAQVHFFEDSELPDTRNAHIAATLHTRLLEVTTGKTDVPLFEQGDTVSFQLGHNAGLQLHERQRLLEITKETERLDYLIDFYRRSIPRAMDDAELKERILLNGHLRTISSIRL